VEDQRLLQEPTPFELPVEVHAEADAQYTKMVVEGKNLAADRSLMVDLKPTCNGHEDDYDDEKKKEMLVYNLMLEIHDYYDY
jgi:hypothetical protein